MPLTQNHFTLVVADIDGVLMDNSHREHLIPTNGGLRVEDWEPFNLACVGDAPIHHMIDLVNYLTLLQDHFVVLCTGRSETCRTVTLDMLADCGLRVAMSARQWDHASGRLRSPTPNLMASFRGSNDHRKGWEYKAGVLAELLDAYQPRRVVFIDDDPRNIQAAIAVCADTGIHITPITVRPHNGCPAVRDPSSEELAAIRTHRIFGRSASAPLPSLREARDDLEELLNNAREDRAPGEIGLAEALDFLDECLGAPADPPRASHVAGWIAKDRKVDQE